MSQTIVSNLINLLQSSGKPYQSGDKAIQNSYKDFKNLFSKAQAADFKIQSKYIGNPYANKNKLVKNYFWIPSVSKTNPDGVVSISAFLTKDNDGNPYIRISVEIRSNPTQKEMKEIAFKARPTYAKMLKIPLANDLFYYYSGNFSKEYDPSIVTTFINDISAEDHVEVVKKIRLENIEDETLLDEMKEGFLNLLPYYKIATGQKESPENNSTLNHSSLITGFPKNLILFGPPGTGKTYNSVAYAEAIIKKDKSLFEKLENDEPITDEQYESLKHDFNADLIEYDDYGNVIKGKICFTTFHQSYSYEDFIEGIFPNVDKKESTNSDAGERKGDISYVLRPGVFKSLCDYAKGKDEYLVIIIDEINRGNISKIFGDLISLVEEGKRIGAKDQLMATLPYSKEKWGVPDNVYIIGTMNTADRSIERLDTALRRRFAFKEMMPHPELLAGCDKCLSLEEKGPIATDMKLSDILTAVNDRIAYIYDRDHQIGHSYFLEIKKNGLDPSTYYLTDLANVFKREVVPLLQEYFYGNYEKIRYVLGEGDDSDEKTNIISLRERSPYANANFSSISNGDDEERIYEINEKAFHNIETYKKILSKEEN